MPCLAIWNLWRCDVNKQDLINAVKMEFSNRRHQAEVKAENYIEKLKQNPEFEKVYLEYNISNLNLIKAKHSKTNVEECQSKFEMAEKNFREFLAKNNISIKKITPQYTCKTCEDKGILDGKMCKCLSDEINKRLSNQNSTYNAFHTFKMINPNKMNENSNRIFKEMFDWCNNFPSDIININLFGSVGTGKTFLLECITSKLRERGFNVVFVTAFAFNEECRKYHFSQPNIMDSFINCDALIIDDLGTEPMLRNITTEYFYNIINLRQTNHKSTLISTNLNPILEPTRLVERYSERTISRLTNKQLSKSYFFSGLDKRN